MRSGGKVTFICVRRRVPSLSDAMYSVTGVGGPLDGGASACCLLRGKLLIARHLSLQMQGVEGEAERDHRQHREHHQDAPGHGRTCGSLPRTAATPAAIDLRHLLSDMPRWRFRPRSPAGGAISTAMAGAAMLFIGRSGASSVVLGSLRDSSSAATEPATEPLKSRNAACAVSHGRKPCGDRLAAGSSDGEHVNALAGVGGMQRDVERGAGCVGRCRALVESDGDVGVAQQAGGDAAIGEFMLHPPRQRQHHILLRQRRGDGRSDVVAAVRRIDQHQKAWRGGRPRRGRGVLRWRSLRRWRRCCARAAVAEQERR